MHWNWSWFFWLLSSSVIFNSYLPVLAQVKEDDSLTTEVTSENQLDFRVEGGEQRGVNLFHSFEQFSVPTDGSVSFDNGAAIQNIIGRVTGNSSSQIDGLIQNNGTANLFLLNPNGIIFGNNAALDIGGSFVGTTAESLLFEDGKFSADLDDASTLLTVNVPLGLQFGRNPGSIVNRAKSEVPSAGSSSQIQLGLATDPGYTLALLGSGITFDGGVATAPGGNFELGSVAANSLVGIKQIVAGWKVDYGAVALRDIRLDNLATIAASGEGGGRINLTSRNLEILGGSAVTSNTLGTRDGQDIEIRASELIRIEGSDRTGTKIDPLLANVGIFLPAASQISSSTLGKGNGGDVKIAAQNLQVLDGGAIELQTFPTSTGNGGNLAITVGNSIQLDGARPLLGVGEDANDIVLPGIDLEQAIALNQSSEISTASISSGNAGNIQLTGKNLTLRNGAVIGVSPFASGDGGDIDLNFSDLLEIAGAKSPTGNFNSTITANTFSEGDAGNLTIKTGYLRLKDGGLLISTTDAVGDAGNIKIDANAVEISGFSRLDRAPSLLSTRTTNGGNGGDIILDTNSLAISDRARISVRGEGASIPGNLAIEADSVELNNLARISAATEFEAGGNIKLNIADNLTLRNGSTISARAFNDANGGNLDLVADFIIATPLENNDILANAVFGSGGNVSIDANGVFGIKEGSSQPANSTNDIDASSQFGLAGEVAISFPNSSILESRNALPELVDVEYLFKNTFCKTSRDSRFVTTGRNGIPFLPDRDVSPVQTWSDWRMIEAKSRANMVEPAASKVDRPQQKQLVMIQGWVTDADGSVVLTDKPAVATSRRTAWNNPDCNQFRSKK